MIYCYIDGKKYKIVEDYYPIFEEWELINIEHALDFFKNNAGLDKEHFNDVDKIHSKIMKYLYLKRKEDLN